MLICSRYGGEKGGGKDMMMVLAERMGRRREM